MKLFAAALAILLALAGAARAEYPDRPIRVIVPFPAGGVTDVVARLLAERLGSALGQTVIVDNKAGAAGVIGSDVVAKAAPDGYTLLFTTPNHTINAAFRTAMPYDTEKDLLPISNVGQVPMLLVSHPSLPVRTYAEFVAYARQNPGRINVSSAGNGTLPHVVMELLMLKERMQVTNVPYRGAAPALADLVAGQVQAKLDTYTTAAAFVADRRLNALAVTSRQRLKQLPEVPAVIETLPGFEGYLWMGLLAPAGTPPAVVARLADEVQRIVASPEVQARFDKDGVEPVGSGPQAFRGQIANEIAQWRELARSTRITVD